MKPRVLAVLALAVLLLTVPAVAQAKGATAATIDGGGPGGLPGGPITLRGDGEPGSGTDLGNLAEASGLFAVMFSGSPDRLPAAPTDRLGPRYAITWTIPDGNGTDRRVRQHLYPYAATGPVTFMPAGQAVFDDTTTGGWYQGFDALRQDLISLGLPNREPLAAATTAKAPTTPRPAPAPAAPAPAPAPAAWPRIAAVLAGLLILAAAAALGLRRHPTSSGTPAH